MKNLNLLLLIIITVFSNHSVFAQNNFDEISQSLKDGNVKNILNFLDKKVELVILDNDTYTINEAEIVLNDFFLNKSNAEFVAIHKGRSENNSFYQIGELTTNNETFRTYCFTKEIDGNFLVQELRIEKQ